jgi:hypothetical protein
LVLIKQQLSAPPQDLQPLEQMLGQQHWGNAEMADQMLVFNAFFG